MPRQFDITTPVSSLSLDPAGKGEIAFTVSNTQAVPIRALASLQPSPPLKPGWLRLRGANERDMPPGSTEVFIVDVQAPPDAPRALYTFRMIVADAAVPDERFTEGPAVSVEVSAPAPIPARPFSKLWLILGALVLGGIVVAVVARDKPQPAVKCPSSQTLCDGLCIDTQSHAQHCGGCGNACTQDQTCRSGACQCAEGLIFCAGACVNPNTSDAHCGRCDQACGEHFDCSKGQCVRTGCPAKQTLCNGTCVDTETDTRNCGGCNRTCAPHLVCRSGLCACPGALTDCGGNCLDTTSDERNCGRCGVQCGAAQVCQGGACQCSAAGHSLCSGRCVDTRSDRQNCGGCGARCGTGQACQNGTCQCGPGLSFCEGSCISFQDNDAHCGRCGNQCSATQTCRGTRCVTDRPPPPDDDDECRPGTELCACTRTCMSPAVCARVCRDKDIDPF